MNSVARWIATFVCIVALALSASAQSNGALPEGQNSLAHVRIINSDRTVLHDDIVHYRYAVVVGPGQFDKIRLHRIVKESHPYWPARTVDAVLLLPGSPNSFEAIFMEPLISEVPAWDRSIAVYLAKNNIDVWGMDYGWALVPAKTTDFNFMRGWGVEKDTRHTEIALSLARLHRGITGQGFGQFHLLGFSYGGIVAYSLAGEETQQPHFSRNVKGIILGDVPMKLEEKSIRDFYCSLLASDEANLQAGVYSDDSGVFLKQLSDLAISAPLDPSPIIPDVTNFQAALAFGASTWLLDGNPMFWHFVGGYLDENSIPSDLRYTEARLWLDLIGALPPHLPMQSDFDVDAVFCGEVKVPFDDHLREIAVPILYAGAGGGYGPIGYYTTTLTASKDITKFTVQLQTDDQRMLDFGHADLFMARDAETLAWKPILDWLVAHR